MQEKQKCKKEEISEIMKYEKKIIKKEIILFLKIIFTMKTQKRRNIKNYNGSS
jgi:hypothetical protein